MKILLFFLLTLLFWQHIDAQEPKLVLPVGHTSSVNSAVFSPDGKTILTASNDNTAKIWDAESGKLLQNLEGHTSWVRSAVFSPDGTKILTSSYDSTFRTWDTKSGEIIEVCDGQKEKLKFAEFSPDGRYIITVSTNGLIRLWHSERIKLRFNLGILESKVEVNGNGIAFSQDGKYILTASRDSSARIWDTETGTNIQVLKGHKNKLTSVSFSPNGKLILTASHDKTAIIWNSNTSEIVYILKGHLNWLTVAKFNPDGTKILTAAWGDKNLKIWDTNSGKLEKKIRTKNWGYFYPMFNNEGSYLIAGLECWNLNENKVQYKIKGQEPQFNKQGTLIITHEIWDGIRVHVWDAKTGKLLRTLEGLSKEVFLNQIENFKNQHLVLQESNNTIALWNLLSRNSLKLFQAENFMDRVRINHALFNMDGSKITAIFEQELAYVYDLNLETVLNDFNVHSKSIVHSVNFSPNGLQLLTCSGYAKLWDIKSGKVIQKFKGHKYHIKSAKFNNNGNQIITIGGWDNIARLWDVNSGKMVKSFKATDFLVSADFNPDGTKLFTSSIDGNTQIWDIKKVKEIFSFEGSSPVICSDGLKLITTEGNSANVWDLNSGKLIYQTEEGSHISSVTFSKNNECILLVSGNNVSLRNYNTGNLLHVLKGHVSKIHSAVFSPDGKYVLTTGADHKTILWDVATGKQLYTRLQLKDGDWLVYDEHYRYDGTPGARDYLYFVCGLEVIDLAQVKDALYVPDLAQRIMQGQEINYPKLSELHICDAFPVIEQKTSGDRGEVLYEITPRNLGLKEVEVYVNSKRIAVIPKEALEQVSNKYVLRLNESDLEKHFLSGYTNKVEVIGVVEDGSAQLRSRGVIQDFQSDKDPTPPTIYGVFVGVKNYKDPALNLGFAAKDAQDLRKTFSLSAQKFLGEANVETYLLHNDFEMGGMDGAPQRESIRKTLEDIGKKSKPQDVVLLFFAGHGEMQGNEEKYFTILTEESGKNNFTGISTKDLISWLSYDGPHKMLANKTILILDACNSGQATKELMAMARNDDESRRIRQVEDLKDKSGMFIFAASAANQSAYEMPQYQQGLMTYSLLHTLKNDASILDAVGLLNLQKWFLQSERYLKEMVERHGLQQQAQPFGTANIDIAKVDDEVRNSIMLVGEKATVVLENVFNTAIELDDLDLKSQLAKELSSISQRGSSSFNFVQQNTTDAYKINIAYTTKKGKLDATLRLVKDKVVVYERTYKNMLVEALIEAIVKDVKLKAVKE